MYPDVSTMLVSKEPTHRSEPWLLGSRAKSATKTVYQQCKLGWSQGQIDMHIENPLPAESTLVLGPVFDVWISLDVWSCFIFHIFQWQNPPFCHGTITVFRSKLHCHGQVPHLPSVIRPVCCDSGACPAQHRHMANEGLGEIFNGNIAGDILGILGI